MKLYSSVWWLEKEKLINTLNFHSSKNWFIGQSHIHYVFVLIARIRDWLNESTDELKIKYLNIYRCDWFSHTSNKSREGGVHIVVRKSLIANYVIIGANIVSNRFVVDAAYNSPKSNIELYQAHIDAVFELAFPYSEFIIFGDYNIPDSIWILSDNGLDLICAYASPGNHINDTVMLLT